MGDAGIIFDPDNVEEIADTIKRLWFDKKMRRKMIQCGEERMAKWNMKGWFQNEQYFASIRDILLEELQPKREVKKNITLEKLLQEKNIVSVHIRKG